MAQLEYQARPRTQLVRTAPDDWQLDAMAMGVLLCSSAFLAALSLWLAVRG